MKTTILLKYIVIIIFSILLVTGCQLSAVTPTVKVESTLSPTQRINTAVPPLIPSNVPTFTELPVNKPTATSTPILLGLTPLPLPSTWIAFLAPDEFGNPFYLNVIKPDGSGQRAVQLDSVNPENYTSSCWPTPRFSPDGRYLAIHRIADPTAPRELVIIDTLNWQVVTKATGFGWSFSWSPDSRHVLHNHPLEQDPNNLTFTSDQGLWILDIPSGNEYQLIPPIPDYAISEVNWSPDGKRIAMHQAFYEGLGLFGIINSDGSGFKKWDSTTIGSFDWSPDGQKIVYDEVTYTAFPPANLWIMNADGSQPTLLFGQATMAASYPVWSPDGRLIAFRDANDPQGEGHATLWLVEPTGQNAHPLNIIDLKEVTWMSWAPDSKHLVVNNNKKVYLVSIDGSTPVLLAEGGCPTWQP